MLNRLIQGLVDIIYPKICFICKNKIVPQVKDTVVCRPCEEKILINPPPFCRSCGRQLKTNSTAKGICPGCIKNHLYFDRAFSPCIYDGVIRDLIGGFKYKNRDYFGKYLSQFMINFIREYRLPVGYIDLVTPIPLHRSRLREREFNQARVLAEHIAREFNKVIDNNILIRHRHTLTQTELGIKERFTNIKGCFSLKKGVSLKNKNILLVDDVLTTGATTSEAAKTLKEAGAAIVFVLTLAN